MSSDWAINLAKSEKGTYSKVPSPIGMIDALDMEFTPVKEDWNVYKLDDGTIIKVKMGVARISRGIDPRTNDVFVQPNGEPVFGITPTIIVAAQFPKDVLDRYSKKVHT